MICRCEPKADSDSDANGEKKGLFIIRGSRGWRWIEQVRHVRPVLTGEWWLTGRKVWSWSSRQRLTTSVADGVICWRWKRWTWVYSVNAEAWCWTQRNTKVKRRQGRSCDRNNSNHFVSCFKISTSFSPSHDSWFYSHDILWRFSDLRSVSQPFNSALHWGSGEILFFFFFFFDQTSSSGPCISISRVLPLKYKSAHCS